MVQLKPTKDISGSYWADDSELMYELILFINMLYDIRQLRKKRIAAHGTVYLFVSTLCIKAYWLIHSYNNTHFTTNIYNELPTLCYEQYELF